MFFIEQYIDQVYMSGYFDDRTYEWFVLSEFERNVRLIFVFSLQPRTLIPCNLLTR